MRDFAFLTAFICVTIALFIHSFIHLLLRTHAILLFINVRRCAERDVGLVCYGNSVCMSHSVTLVNTSQRLNIIT